MAKGEHKKFKKSLIRQSHTWKMISTSTLILHTIMIIVSSVMDIVFGLGLVLYPILAVNAMALIVEIFGYYSLCLRHKTGMLFYTLCAIGFAIIMICIEITYEMRNYVFGQNSDKCVGPGEPCQNMEPTVTAREFSLFLASKYTRIITSIISLCAGGSVYLYRQAIVKQALGNYAGNLDKIKEIQFKDEEVDKFINKK
ncbi:unnamed protein product [Moneuplotes crassus]|uniref:Transmembrane protein n=1 Tax=Euplotes crassus TaxID=5936 RepID=A0AAD1Y1Y6_EUPCR|nr:unnamed protein product [Moneuplotes crassus]